jgi:DNA modification methylase
MKPRLLVEDALIDVTNRGDIVIDCFAGSGSTLVAAEATGRRCWVIEFDGPYCDVIIRRWSAMTGQEAVLEATSETFAEVEARRSNEGPVISPWANMNSRWSVLLVTWPTLATL